MVRWQTILCLAFISLAAACRKPPETAHSGAPESTATARVFQVKGVIQAVRSSAKEVEIKHEAIPDYMPGMTMPFPVKDTNELAGLKPGQRVSFRLNVTDTDGWIDRIQPIEESATNGPPAGSSIRVAKDVEPLQVGDVLPEYHLTDQFGQSFSTAQFKGQALAITFLFTRCPFPTFCPLMANHFGEAQQKLLTTPGAPSNWHLLTVSFDPAFDSPAVLKAYAQGHQYDPKYWTFATGSLSDITALGEQFGLAFWHDETGSISHNLRTAIIDSQGKVQAVFQGNNWTSDELVTELTKAAKQGKPAAPQ